MSLPRYSEYKDSGVEWLGEVPGHWDVLPCRAFVDEQTAKNDDGKNKDYLSLMANVGIIPYADKGDVGNKKPEDLTKCKLVSKGDFVINSMNYGIGSYGLSALDGICSPVYIVLRPRPDRIESRYAFRIFENRAFQTFAQSFGNGILEHRAAINWDILKSIGVGIPPKEEQIAILNFLDRETGKIDALIAEQQQLVELLAEKRQAVISHAVTKGLNPNARMKDSGIEWLGELPEHWEMCAIKRMTLLITDGAHISPETDDGIYDFVSTKDVSDSGIDFESCLKTSPSSYEYLVRSGCQPTRGDVLFSKDGTIGRTVVVKEEREFVVASSLIIIRPDSAVLDSTFLHYLCRSFLVIQQVEGFVKGAGLPRLSIQNLLKVFGVFPQLEEQQIIAAHLDTETAKFDTLTAEANRAIALLQERRSALISAAVTGKIDVRQAA
ncbi:MAG: restriction endonuclease subunit S [Gallionella sp.]|nr:restriction endonuclease subunit S [Gallionella sp.]